jgi:hypothetical protein
MALLSRWLLPLLIGLTTGCDFLREPSPVELSGEEVLVHSLLLTGSDTVSVYLTRSRPGRGTPVPVIQPISGADVRIVGSGGSVRLAEDPPGLPRCFVQNTGLQPATQPGCYGAFLPGGVKPGARYELQIALPGGGTIEGTAVVPQPLVILTPEHQHRILAQTPNSERPEIYGSVQTRWGGSGDVGRVQFGIESLAVLRNGVRVPSASCGFETTSVVPRGVDARATDSAFVGFQVLNCFEEPASGTLRPIEPDSIQARFVITAFDTAYTRYAEVISKDAVERRHLSVGVRGALGVFAGAATSEQRITVLLNRR